MKETRHPHPHIDPRQPRDRTKPGTNPPVFVWKPVNDSRNFRLTVSREPTFRNLWLDLRGVEEPVYLPEKAFAPGNYFWKWSDGLAESEVFSFEITPGAVVLEAPPAGEWLKRFPEGHPRIGERTDVVPANAADILAEPHELAEPQDERTFR